jgi:hypothetical protein
MKKILLFITSDPASGGSFQYDLCILDAVASFPKDSYDVQVFYTNRVWVNHIDGGIPSLEVSLGQLNKRMIQLVMMAGFPLSWLRKIFRRFHPLAKALIAQEASLYIFPSQETSWSYLVDVPALAVIHDLMHRYERHFPEVSNHGRFKHRERHFSAICRLSKGILVDSEFGKVQVEESYSAAADKIFPLRFIPPRYLFDYKLSPDFDARYRLPPKFVFYPAQFDRGDSCLEDGNCRYPIGPRRLEKERLRSGREAGPETQIGGRHSLYGVCPKR